MHCHYCQKNQKDIDFKDTLTQKRFLALSGKIKSRKKTNLCAKHQRRLAQSVKRARILALLPFVRS